MPLLYANQENHDRSGSAAPIQREFKRGTDIISLQKTLAQCLLSEHGSGRCRTADRDHGVLGSLKHLPIRDDGLLQETRQERCELGSLHRLHRTQLPGQHDAPLAQGLV